MQLKPENLRFNLLKTPLNRIKQLLWDLDYSTGYYQRLGEGYGFIHAPRRNLLPERNPKIDAEASFKMETL